MRIGHSLKPNFLNNAALQRGKVDFPDHWCEGMKKENYRKQDVTVSDLARNKNVSLLLSFFFFLKSVAYLSSFLSVWVRCTSLLFYDYEFIGRASFITNFENRSVKRLSRGRQATSSYVSEATLHKCTL